LILVTGTTGCGKSTTLAAMIDLINSSRTCHIVTIEDPIEFLHAHKNCIVNQREVGAHHLQHVDHRARGPVTKNHDAALSF
jgi:twitching motility protein PilT